LREREGMGASPMLNNQNYQKGGELPQKKKLKLEPHKL